MRIKIMPLPSTIQMGQKKRTTSAAVSTTFFGPNSLKPQGDSLENTAKKNSSILREKNYRKIAETLYKSGVITMATFDRESTCDIFFPYFCQKKSNQNKSE